MEEEDRNRYNILIDRGAEVFERVENNISNLNARNMTLVGVILATLSIILTLVLFLRQVGLQFSNVDWILLYLFLLFSVISLVITISLSIPTEYKDLDIFKQERFDELLRMHEQTLFEDFLYHFKEAYEYNLNKYKNRMWWFTIALYSFIIADIIFIILVAKSIIGG
jgi:ABC-type transport system involved in Fe-S cluster assembly fused permease/ATPase subunit